MAHNQQATGKKLGFNRASGRQRRSSAPHPLQAFRKTLSGRGPYNQSYNPDGSKDTLTGNYLLYMARILPKDPDDAEYTYIGVVSRGKDRKRHIFSRIKEHSKNDTILGRALRDRPENVLVTALDSSESIFDILLKEVGYISFYEGCVLSDFEIANETPGGDFHTDLAPEDRPVLQVFRNIVAGRSLKESRKHMPDFIACLPRLKVLAAQCDIIGLCLDDIKASQVMQDYCAMAGLDVDAVFDVQAAGAEQTRQVQPDNQAESNAGTPAQFSFSFPANDF